jgi:hypothetical protein
MTTNTEQVFDRLTAVMATHAFQTRFPTARLLRTASEIEAARANLPVSLVPFMREDQQQWPDIYAFSADDRQRERIVVWSDHAIVAGWDTFDAFLDWVRGDPPMAPP